LCDRASKGARISQGRNFSMVLRIAAIGLAAALISIAGANAQDSAPRKGIYVGGQVGFSKFRDSDVTGPGINTEAEFNTGLAAAGALGYALGNNIRIEAEIATRGGGVDNVGGAGATGDVRANSLMVNGLYDFATGNRVRPYIGAGIGVARIDADGAGPIGGSTTSDEDTVFAWQGIAGVAFPLSSNLDLALDYRYFQSLDPDLRLASGTQIEAEAAAHTVLLGLRWYFGGAKPAPKPMPVAAPAPPPPPKPKPVAKPKPKPAPPQTFIVFFDWDKDNIRPDAQRIIERAAAYAKSRGFARIQLTGHADRSGAARYNQGLSERRAANVKKAFVALGLKAGEISTVGLGESKPLVATADGVREPRNRRVEIVF
jgi:outer membrane protein OmpA-like peptidoglycan-associated protein